MGPYSLAIYPLLVQSPISSMRRKETGFISLLMEYIQNGPFLSIPSLSHQREKRKHLLPNKRQFAKTLSVHLEENFRFHILARPLRNWYLEDIVKIPHCCVILHNMVVEARAGDLGDYEDIEINNNTFPLFGCPQITPAMAQMDGVNLFAARMDAFDNMIQSVTEHYKLKYDLIEHIHQHF